MKKIILLVLIFILPAVLHAKDVKPKKFSGSIRINKNHSNYDINADGTHVETHSMIIEVLDEDGIDIANSEEIGFSESLEELTLGEFYTLKKDGTKVKVPAENIQDRAAIATGGPMYSDIKVKSIIFPDVTVGDSVVYTYSIKQKAALFPGHFSETRVFSRSTVQNDVRFSVSVPAKTLNLNVFADGVRGGKVATKDGRLKWVWTYSNAEIEEPEASTIDIFEYSPRIIVSTFKDYAELGAAYELRARPKAAVTERVQKLADKITEGIKDRREQARAMYVWVSENINFAGNCIGVGSVVPHDTDMILNNLLGDCKDHAALYQALLAAKGIDSVTALINAGRKYKFPSVVSTSAINHVINYIPEFDLYADSGVKGMPFGELPTMEMDKPVILTSGSNPVRRTPTGDYRKTLSSMNLKIEIHEDGSADAVSSNSETGNSAAAMRSMMRSIKPNVEELLVNGILSKSGFSGTGALKKSDPMDIKPTYEYGASFHINNFIELQDTGAFYVWPLLRSAHTVASGLAIIDSPAVKYGIVCVGDIATEDYTYVFPKKVKFVSIPKNVNFNLKTLSYSATYKVDGNVLTVSRRREDRKTSNVCTPEDDLDYRAQAKEIRKDIKSQLIYKVE